MEKPTADGGDPISPAQTRVLLNTSLSALYWSGGAILLLCGTILGLWLDSYSSRISALDRADVAEAAARIQLEIRVSALEKYAAITDERDKRQEEIMRENKARIDRHQGDGHGWRGGERP